MNWKTPDQVGTITMFVGVGFLLLDLVFRSVWFYGLATFFILIALIFKFIALYWYRVDTK